MDAAPTSPRPPPDAYRVPPEVTARRDPAWTRFDPHRVPTAFPSRPILVGNEIYRHSVYGQNHPLSIQRVTPAIDMARAMGWLDGSAYVESPQAAPDQLQRFHDPDYVAAVVEAERTRHVPEPIRERYNIGRNGNPVFAEIFRRPATSSGECTRRS